MTEFTSEEIKNRLSNIGAAIGNIALEYIIKIEEENEQLKKDIIEIEKVSDFRWEENQPLKAQFEKLLEFCLNYVDECDVCELTDTCIIVREYVRLLNQTEILRS